MRLRAGVLRITLVATAALALVAACRSKGNGIGTAPPIVGCPASVVEGAPCPAVDVCGYCGGTCGAPTDCPDGGAASATIFMYCAGGTGSTWVCVEAGDAGGFNDAEVGSEVGSEVDGDAQDAPDAPDAEVDGETSDAGETLDDADATETIADGATEADAAPDAAPDTAIDEADAADAE